MVLVPCALFCISVVLFLDVTGRVKRRSPLAFRMVNVFGYLTSATLAMELARSNTDLQRVLHHKDKGVSRRILGDLRRSVRDDNIVIGGYTIMLGLGAAVIAELLGREKLIAVACFVTLTIIAAGSDLLENRALRSVLGEPLDASPKDRSASIRRWALVKWHLLALVGLAQFVALLVRGPAGARAYPIAVVAYMLLAFGGFCTAQVWRWWRTPNAHW